MSDLAKLMRFHGAIREVLGRLDSPSDVKGVAETYERYRSSVRAIVSPEELAEFDGLHPEVQFNYSPHYIDTNMKIIYGRAKAHLAALLGWLDGAIDAAKYEEQARANAEARLRDGRSS